MKQKGCLFETGRYKNLPVFYLRRTCASLTIDKETREAGPYYPALVIAILGETPNNVVSADARKFLPDELVFLQVAFYLFLQCFHLGYEFHDQTPPLFIGSQAPQLSQRGSAPVF